MKSFSAGPIEGSSNRGEEKRCFAEGFGTCSVCPPEGMDDDQRAPNQDNTDWRDQAEAGRMAFVLGFAAPEAVLVVSAGEGDAIVVHVTFSTDPAGGALTAFARLWTLGGWRKEEVRQTLAGSRVHPVVLCFDSIDRNFDCGH